MKSYRTIILTAIFLMFISGCSDHLQEGINAYKEKNYHVALKELQPLADKGDATAQTFIGFMYDNGEGVTLDYQQAVVWYTKAAEQGNANAQYNLAMMYANGLGVPQDWVQALKWFNLAAASGYENTLKAGKEAEKYMTPKEIEQAWALTDDWRKKHKP